MECLNEFTVAIEDLDGATRNMVIISSKAVRKVFYFRLRVMHYLVSEEHHPLVAGDSFRRRASLR